MKNYLKGILYDNDKPSISRVMALIWFFLLVVLAIRFIWIYGSVVAEGSVVNIPDPEWMILVFVIVMSYVFGSKVGISNLIRGRSSQKKASK